MREERLTVGDLRKRTADVAAGMPVVVYARKPQSRSTFVGVTGITPRWAQLLDIGNEPYDERTEVLHVHSNANDEGASQQEGEEGVTVGELRKRTALLAADMPVVVDDQRGDGKATYRGRRVL